ncbi:MAG: class I SAM-dependent methyltransferase [Janthinobacterium lividum]
MAHKWNHNIQYHPLVLSAIPQHCDRALDVGCGTGLLTRQLASCCAHVTGIDLDRAAIATAAETEPSLANLDFVQADAMTYAFRPASFDSISAVATVHHLPLKPALERFRDLLAPGGVLTIIGLYRAEGPRDALFSTAGFLASRGLRLFQADYNSGAPMQAPRETLPQIRSAADHVLPHSMVKRRLLFRYSLIWHKPL